MVTRAPTPEHLDPIRRAPGSAGIFCDFDGTLAPIVADPARARATSGAADALTTLAGTYRCVAVVSGRPVSFLREALAEPAGVTLVGLYGLETVVDGLLTVDARVDPAAVRSLVEDLGEVEDVWVEDKGLSVALHTRRSSDPLEAGARALARARSLAARGGFAIREGKHVVEVVPDVAVDKGSSTRALIERHGLRAAAAFGDDLGDVAAFEAVTELRSSLRVAVAGPECPPELLAVADAEVAGPPQVVEVLQRLA